MRAIPVKAGDRFNYWTVLNEITKRRSKHRVLRCRCDCGTVKVIHFQSIRAGISLSCGCVRKARATKHGMWKTPEYSCWATMIYRCSNKAPKTTRRNYIRRGIAVCDEWKRSFVAFYDHVGPRPSPQHSLDRINNDSGYEPGNVRWATGSEQRKNKRCSIWERTLLLVGEMAGITKDELERLVDAGLSDQELSQHIARSWYPRESAV